MKFTFVTPVFRSALFCLFYFIPGGHMIFNTSHCRRKYCLSRGRVYIFQPFISFSFAQFADYFANLLLIIFAIWKRESFSWDVFFSHSFIEIPSDLLVTPQGRGLGMYLFQIGTFWLIFCTIPHKYLCTFHFIISFYLLYRKWSHLKLRTAQRARIFYNASFRFAL